MNMKVFSTVYNKAVSFFSKAVSVEVVEDEIVQTTGYSDRFKERTISTVGTFGSFAIALVLGLGNGYFFADFQPLKYDPWILMAYGGGFLIEFIAISVLFKSSKHFYDKRWVAFCVTFSVVLLFAIITMITQYLMMDYQLKQHNVVITDQMVEQIPIFNFIVGIAGLKGSTGFLIMRAAMYHLGEIACVFLVPTRKPDYTETMRLKSEAARQTAIYNQQKGIYDIQKSLDGMMSSIISGLVDGVARNASALVPESPVVKQTVVTPVQTRPREQVAQHQIPQTKTPSQNLDPQIRAEALARAKILVDPLQPNPIDLDPDGKSAVPSARKIVSISPLKQRATAAN